MNILKPTLLIDEAKAKANIKRMVEKAKANNLTFRPHFKTHQSNEIGEWFKEQGVSSITVSSLEMAEYFAKAGWKEITVAFPCNILQIELINNLAQEVNLIVLVDNEEVVSELDKLLMHKVSIFIEIDTGTHRTGVLWDNTALIQSIAKIVDKSTLLKLKGCYCHSGKSYSSRGLKLINEVYQESIQRIGKLKMRIGDRVEDLEFCYGDTPTCSVRSSFEHIDALSPGNFTFYDIMQEQIGSCDYSQIAVAMACPVVSINQTRREVCIYGGAIHFSKDAIIEDGQTVFGKLVDFEEGKWGSPNDESYIKSLSQEHGLVQLSDERFDKIKVGDILYFLPVHSCLTADCMKRYLTLEGKVIEHF